MHVALIAPPFDGMARGVPLGLAHLASMLELEGIQVSVLDMTICDDSYSALSRFLTQCQPDVVGISAVCATYISAVETARACRSALSSAVWIVGGGPHVTFGASTILKNHPSFDVCVLGEAEYSFRDFCLSLDRRDKDAWKSVPGIAFRDGSKIVHTPPRKMAEDLDCLPLPSRSHFLQSDYPHGHLDAVGMIGTGSSHKAEVIASRGCPYPCGFCSTKEFWQRSYRTRSPEHIVSELALLREMGHSEIYFNDDIFTVKRKWIVELCELLVEHDPGIRWACGTRVDRVDKELLILMKAAGCIYVYFGVESGNELINQKQQKGASIAKIERAYSLLQEVGIFSSAAIIFGLPGETWETAAATIDWVRDVIRPDEVWISKATCYPGTALAREFSIDAEDYELRVDGRCVKGLPYGTGGILTPFFNDVNLVTRIWDYAKCELAAASVAFGDDHGLPFVQ